MLKAETVCRECNKTNEVFEGILKNVTAYDKDGIEIYLLCYTCPLCGTLNVVQIDNAITNRTLAECKRILRYGMRENGTAKNSMKKKYNKLCKKLSAQRQLLNKSYSGAELFDSAGETFIKSLTLS